MSTTEINWRQNCLTNWIHDGRPEAIWNLPLRQAAFMFGHDGLKAIVVARIRQDAQQLVDHIADTPTDLADKVAKQAEFYFLDTLERKLTEIEAYYTSPTWKKDVENVVTWVHEGVLNPHYQPLHGHDSVNLLCRILGQSVHYKVLHENE